MMKTFSINNTHYREADLEVKFIGFGGEGSVYQLNSKYCFKNFNESILNSENKMNKVLVLCDKSDYLSKIEGFDCIAIPIHPAYHKKNVNESVFCGFSMHHFKNCMSLGKVIYDCFDQRYNIDHLNDEKMVSVITDLYYKLKIIHSAKIILGDVNSNNILLDKNIFTSYFIDIDSAKINEFDCRAGINTYMCPSVIQLGRNSNGGFSYSLHSDIYSLTLLAFESMVGVHPFDIPMNPIISLKDAKSKGMSFISLHQFGSDYYKLYKVVDKQALNVINKRLTMISKKYPMLYQFFLDTFHYQKREYFKVGTIQKKQVTPKKAIRPIKAVRGISRTNKKSDPKELSLFLKTYNLI